MAARLVLGISVANLVFLLAELALNVFGVGLL